MTAGWRGKAVGSARQARGSVKLRRLRRLRRRARAPHRLHTEQRPWPALRLCALPEAAHKFVVVAARGGGWKAGGRQGG
jgi:hypothetical protein